MQKDWLYPQRDRGKCAWMGERNLPKTEEQKTAWCSEGCKKHDLIQGEISVLNND